jgi:hypothetical protein
MELIPLAAINSEGWSNYGLIGLVAGGAFATAHGAIQLARTYIERRLRHDDALGVAEDFDQVRQCALTGSRMTEIHETIGRWDRDLGQFHCAWKDRDEVVLLGEAMKNLASELRTLTHEFRKYGKTS